jgi:nucleoside-diphosphate-sugar epimerase
MDRPVLVTGGTGFIGRHIVSALQAQGQRVRVLLRRPETASSLTALGAEVLVGDLLDPAAIERAASGVRGVFHLAGQLFSPGVRPETYTDLHVSATVALLRACTQADRLDFFVLCSTTGMHGPTGAVPAREEDPGHPQNAYELTKAQGEHAATAIARSAGLPLVIARPGLVYGPGDRHLLGWFRAIQGGYYRVIGPGDNHLHPIYVADLVRAVLLCESAASVACRAYHLVGSRAVTVRELSDAIGVAVKRRVPDMHIPARAAFAMGAALEALPVPRRALPLTRSRVRFLLQNRAYDGTRAREELGFVPQVDLADGLSRTVAWYRENGLL